MNFATFKDLSETSYQVNKVTNPKNSDLILLLYYFMLFGGLTNPNTRGSDKCFLTPSFPITITAEICAVWHLSSNFKL